MTATHVSSARVVPISTARKLLASKGWILNDSHPNHCTIEKTGRQIPPIRREERGSEYLLLRDLLDFVPVCRAEFIAESMEKDVTVAPEDVRENSEFRIVVYQGDATDKQIEHFRKLLQELDAASGASVPTKCVVVPGKREDLEEDDLDVSTVCNATSKGSGHV